MIGTLAIRGTAMAVALTGGVTIAVAAQAASYTLNMSHASPFNDPYQEAFERFAAAVMERTDGDIQVNVHGNGTLAGLAEGCEGTSLGTIEIAACGAGPLGNFDPALGASALPFLWDSIDHYNRAMAGEYGELYKTRLEDRLGVVRLGGSAVGFRYIISTNREIRNAEDVRGLKIRLPGAAVYVDTFRALGANGTPLAWREIYTALQTGVVDAAEGAAEPLVGANLTEVASYVADTKHILNTNHVIMNKGIFDSLPADYQDIILEEGDRHLDAWLTEARVGSIDDAIATLQEHLTWTTSEDMASSFREATASVITRFVDDYDVQDWIDAVDAAR